MRDVACEGGAPHVGSAEEALPPEAREELRALARRALEHGVCHGAAPPVDLPALHPALRRVRATFVTLERAGALRGCIGTLEACEPLALSAARNAVKAARDPRLAPVAPRELDALQVKISVLSPLELLAVESEAELLARLRPGVDGLVLRDDPHAATFLPAVWESLTTPREFVRELKRKALLPEPHWSATTRCWRYTVDEVR